MKATAIKKSICKGSCVQAYFPALEAEDGTVTEIPNLRTSYLHKESAIDHAKTLIK
jgi:hypothetical protein